MEKQSKSRTSSKDTAKAKSAPKTAKSTQATAATAAAPVAQKPLRRMLVGQVLSNKMQKTIVVSVDRRIRHGLYKKYVTKSCSFKAHDEKNDANIGDLVTIVETRPLSKDKRWALQSIVRRANQGPEANV